MKKIIVFLLMVSVFCPFSVSASTSRFEVTLSSCVDGDTARFYDSNNEEIKARFLAIDTPETVHPTKGVEPFGKEASDYTCNSLKNAKKIELEYDSDSDEEDKYGRKLVWVFVDDTLLQNSLISLGYAEVAYLYGDYKYTPQLQDSEEVAKASKLGVWSDQEYSTSEEEEETSEKGFFENIFDSLLGAITDFIDDLLEKLSKLIWDML